MKMNVLSVFERQTLPFHFSVEPNGKNVFTLAPRKVVEWLEWFSLCSANAVLVSYLMHACLNFWIVALVPWCANASTRIKSSPISWDGETIHSHLCSSEFLLFVSMSFLSLLADVVKERFCV